MGCICYPKKNNINILSNLNDMKINNSTNCELSKSIDYITVKNKRKDYFFHINKKGWENILDFFTYKELTIIAQLNSDLRDISKNPRILNKFFKEENTKKEEERSIIKDKNIIQISKTNKTHFLNPKYYFEKRLTNSNINFNNNNINISKENIKTKNENKSQTLIIKMKNKENNNNKKLSPYIDCFTNQKIQIPNNFIFNGYTASVCSSSVSYIDQTPSFSDENISNTKSVFNVTNITTIHINHHPYKINDIQNNINDKIKE